MSMSKFSTPSLRNFAGQIFASKTGQFSSQSERNFAGKPSRVIILLPSRLFITEPKPLWDLDICVYPTNGQKLIYDPVYPNFNPSSIVEWATTELREIFNLQRSAATQAMMAGLVSNLISILAASFAYKQSKTALNSVIQAAAMFSNFVSFLTIMMSISTIVTMEDHRITTTVTDMATLLTDHVKTYWESAKTMIYPNDDTTKHQFDIMNIVKLVSFVGILGISLIAGFTGLGNAASMITKRLSDTGNVMRTIYGPNFSLANLITKFCGESISGQTLKLQALANKCADLLAMPIRALYETPGKLDEIMQLDTEIIDTLAKLEEKPQENSAGRSLSIILATYLQSVSSRKLELAQIAYPSFRVDPIGIFLAGVGAVGKSSLSEYISRQVSKVMGWDGRRYQLNQPANSKHFNTYTGQKIAYIEEYLLNPKEDAIFKSANQLMSSEPFIAPGASLSDKKQNFTAHLVVATSNRINKPQTLPNGDSEVVHAHWTRFKWIKVSDPTVEQAPEARFSSFPHRKPDFSHLDITSYDHVKPNENANPKSWKVKDLLIWTVNQLCKREDEYWRRFLEAYPDLSDTDKEDINKRLAELYTISQGGWHSVNLTDVFGPNAGRDFCVFRYQGPPGAGKTTLVGKHATKLSKGLGLHIMEITSAFEEPLDSPAIYILDDVLHLSNAEQYVAWANKTKPGSILLIATNHAIEPRYNYQSLPLQALKHYMPSNKAVLAITPPPFYYDLRGVYGGYARRAGLTGVHYTDLGFETTDMRFSDTFTCTVNGKTRFDFDKNKFYTLSENDIFELIWKKASHYWNSLKTSYVSLFEPPPCNYDLEITGTSFEAIKTALSTLDGAIRVFSGRNDDVTMDFRCPMSKFGAISGPSSFVIPFSETTTPQEMAVALMTNIVRADVGVNISVTTPTDRVYLVNQRIYQPTNQQEALPVVIPIIADFNAETVHICQVGVAFAPLTTKQIAEICVGEGDLTAHAYELIVALKRLFSEEKRPDIVKAVSDFYVQSDVNHSIDLFEQHFAQFSWWKLLVGLGGAIVSVFTIHKLVKMILGYFDLIPKKNPGKYEKKPCECGWNAGHITYASEHASIDIGYCYMCKSGKTIGSIKKNECELTINQATIDDIFYVACSYCKWGCLSDDHILDFFEEMTGQQLDSIQPNARRRGRPAGKWRRMTDEEYEEYKRARKEYEDNERSAHEKYRTSNSYGVARAMGWEHPSATADNDNWRANNKQPSGNGAHKRSTDGYGTTWSPNMLRVTQPVSSHESLHQQLAHKIEKNIIIIKAKNAEAVHGIVIKGHTILSVNHIFMCEGPYYAHFDDQGKERVEEIRLLQSNKPRDLAFASFCNSKVPLFPDITKKICTTEDLDYIESSIFVQYGETIEYHTGDATVFHERQNFSTVDTSQNYYAPTEKQIIWEPAGLSTTDTYIRLGDCGLPLLAYTGKNQVQIVGIHNGKSITRALFGYITQEDLVLDEFRANANAMYPTIIHGNEGVMQPELGELTQGLRVSGLKADNIEVLGYHPRFNEFYRGADRKVFVRSKQAKLEQTSWFAPTRTEEVEIKENLYYDPIRQDHSIAFTQMAKYGNKKDFKPNPTAYEMTEKYLEWEYKLLFGDCPILSEGEVINGIRNERHRFYKFSKPMDLDTSAGLVFSRFFNSTSKRDMFVAKDPNAARLYHVYAPNAAGEYLKRSVDYMWDAFSKGQMVFTGAKGCLKQEVLDIKKVKEGGTRLFIAVDLDRHIVRSRLTKSLIYAQMEMRNKGGSSKVGMNIYQEATAIMDFMDEIVGIIIFGDYKRFDKSHPIEIKKSYARNRFNLLPKHEQTPENYMRIMTEELSINNTIISVDGSLCAADQGNLSGQADTTAINDYANKFCCVYSIFRALQEAGEEILDFAFETIRELHRLATLGDDNMTKFVHALNMTFDRHAGFVAELGFVLTPADKGLGGDAKTFCSRTMERSENRLVYPALKKTSIERMLYFFADTTPEQVADNFRTVMIEAALWDEDYYKKIMEEINIQIQEFDRKFNTGARIRSLLNFSTYRTLRAAWTRYIKGNIDFPHFTPEEKVPDLIYLNAKNDCDKPVTTDFDHSNLELNKKITHTHKCEKHENCYYEHSHMIKHDQRSKRRHRNHCEKFFPNMAPAKVTKCPGDSVSAVNWVQEFHQMNGYPLDTITYEFKFREGKWLCEFEDKSLHLGTAKTASSKSAAKELCAEWAVEMIKREHCFTANMSPPQHQGPGFLFNPFYITVSFLSLIKNSTILSVQQEYVNWRVWLLSHPESALHLANRTSTYCIGKYKKLVPSTLWPNEDQFGTDPGMSLPEENTVEAYERELGDLERFIPDKGHLGFFIRRAIRKAWEYYESDFFTASTPDHEYVLAYLSYKEKKRLNEEERNRLRISLGHHFNTETLPKPKSTKIYNDYIPTYVTYTTTYAPDEVLDFTNIPLYATNAVKSRPPQSERGPVYVNERGTPDLPVSKTKQNAYVRSFNRDYYLDDEYDMTHSTLLMFTPAQLETDRRFVEWIGTALQGLLRDYRNVSAFFPQRIQIVFDDSATPAHFTIGPLFFKNAVYPPLEDKNPFFPNMSGIAAPKPQTDYDSSNGKVMQPVMPAVPSIQGTTSGQPPAGGDVPSSNTMASGVNQPNDPQIRANRDQPAQLPLLDIQSGPPNMASMNMHQDVVASYVYRPIHQGQIVAQGGSATGTIVAKWSYGLNLLNPIGAAYVRMHKRFNGRMRLTVDFTGLPAMRGTFILGVMRETPADSVTVIDPAALQLINYTLINVQGSGSYSMDIGDARQTEFFRNVADDPVGSAPADAAKRPCIILAVYVPVVNQFPEGDNQIVLNVRSCAVSPIDDPEFGFYYYEPNFGNIMTGVNSAPSAAQLRMDLASAKDQTMAYIDGDQKLDSLNWQFDSSTWVPHLPLQVTREVPDPDNLTQLFTISPNTVFHGKMPDGQGLRTIIAITQGSPKGSFISTPNGYVLLENEADFYRLHQKMTTGEFFTPSDEEKLVGVVSGVPFDPDAYHYMLGAHAGDNLKCSIKEVRIEDYVNGRIIIMVGEYTALPTYTILEFKEDEDFVGATPLVVQAAEIGTGATLPQGYKNFVVASTGQTAPIEPLHGAPILSPDLTFASIFRRFATSTLVGTGIPCADVVDSGSGRLVMTLGWFNDQLVINTPFLPASHYEIYGSLNNWVLTNPRRLQTLPTSPLDLNVTRLDPAVNSSAYRAVANVRSKQRAAKRLAMVRDTTFTPNFFGALVGGALGGIGGAIGDAQKRSHEKQMQQNDFAHQREMANQQNEWNTGNREDNQAHEKEMAGANFGYQEQLQRGQFGHQRGMQENQFGQDRRMQANDQAHQMNYLAQQHANNMQIDRQRQDFQIQSRGFGSMLRQSGAGFRQLSGSSTL